MKKTFTSKMKLKIALEAIKGDMTIRELGSRYEVSPAQIHRWKQQLLEHGAELFESSQKSTRGAHEQEIQKLHANIGRLTVENDPGSSPGQAFYLVRSCV